MTKQQTQYAIEVMEAWLEGKPIEVNQFGRWTDLRTDQDPKWNWEILYRVKPEPRRFWILDRNLCTSEKDAKEALGVFGNVICVEEVLE